MSQYIGLEKKDVCWEKIEIVGNIHNERALKDLVEKVVSSWCYTNPGCDKENRLKTEEDVFNYLSNNGDNVLILYSKHGEIENNICKFCKKHYLSFLHEINWIDENYDTEPKIINIYNAKKGRIKEFHNFDYNDSLFIPLSKIEDMINLSQKRESELTAKDLKEGETKEGVLLQKLRTHAKNLCIHHDPFYAWRQIRKNGFKLDEDVVNSFSKKLKENESVGISL